MNVVIYEKNEIGFGYGLYIVDLSDFDTSNEDERTYKEAVLKAIQRKDRFGYRTGESSVHLHHILENRLSKVKELKLPIQIDHAVYIYCE